MDPRYNNPRKRKIKKPILDMIWKFRSDISRVLAYIGMFSGQNKWMDVDKVRIELDYCRKQLDRIIEAMDMEYGPAEEKRAEKIMEMIVYNRETSHKNVKGRQ